MRWNERNERGFTLLELILGLVITALVLAILLAVMRLGYRSQQKGEARTEVAQHMRIVSDRLAWLVRGAYPYRYPDEEEQRLLFRGDVQSLEFVTTSVDNYTDSLEDRAGLKLIKIYSTSDGLQTQEQIFFMGDEDGTVDGAEFVIDPTVSHLEFEYLDVDPDSKEELWTTIWDTDSKDYLPGAVRIKMTFIHDGKLEEVPPVIATIRTGGITGVQPPNKAGI